MSDSDRLVLPEIIKQEKQNGSPNVTDSGFFEIFSAEQILKERGFDLDPEQVVSGVVGGGDDGGVDSFYTFANRRLVREDSDLAALAEQQVSIEVVIIQSKLSAGFQEHAVAKLSDFTDHCLRLTSDLTSVPKDLYNAALLSAVELFHQLYKRVLTKKPKLSITYCYATLGETVHPKVETRQKMLEAKCKGHYSAADVECQLVGAAQLLSYYNKAPSTTLTLTTTKVISLSAFGTSYICLVPLPKFYEFITEKDVLRGHIFEANVRDFQGNVTVNNQIGVTLAVVGNEEFWWLNNGITILCTEAVGSGDLITITDPLIVNGLQTSFVLYNHFRDLERYRTSETFLCELSNRMIHRASIRLSKRPIAKPRYPRSGVMRRRTFTKKSTQS
jgi:hypothetical protein